MSHTNQPRAWYVPDALVDDYRAVADSGGNLEMLKTLKILRSIIVNLGIIGIALFALATTGADATLVSTVGLVTLGLYNGVEVADYAALATAFAEAKAEDSTDTNE